MTGRDQATAERAGALVRQGGVIAHATEGVWGLACDPFDTVAIERLLAIKGRAVDQGLIVAGMAAEVFEEELASLEDARRADIVATWPGPTTWLVPNHRFSEHVVGRHPTVAVRVPGHEQARRICAASGGLLISTSANRSGEPSAMTFDEAVAAVGSCVDFVVPGETNGRGAASRIVDAATGNELR